MRISSVYLGLSASLLLVQGLSAQDQLPVVSETVNVRVVNIEVVVTDSSGNRVTDLPPDAFELKVDRTPRKIQFFQEIIDREVRRASGTGAGVAGQAVPLRFLLFIDDQQAIAADRNRVLDGISKQFDLLEANDQVAVVAFDGTKLTLLSGWTRDRTSSRAAILEAKRRPARGMERLAALLAGDEGRRLKSELADAMEMPLRNEASALGESSAKLANSVADDFRAMMDRTAFLDGSEPSDRDLAVRIEGETRRVVAGASAALRSLSGGSGRKTMMLLSGGWPLSALEYVSSDGSKTSERAFSEALEAGDGGKLFEPLFDLANTLAFTLYPVDLSGVERNFGGADFRTPFGSVYGSDIDRDTSQVVQVQQGGVSREEQSHLPLELLADRTGGLALLNASSDTAVSRVVDDSASYYWLGFAFDSARNDTRHRVDVRLTESYRKGNRVRARQSFADPSQETESTRIVEAGLLFGDTSGAAPLKIQFGAPREVGRRRIEIDIELRIPLATIELVDLGSDFQGQLDVRMAVLDERGNRSDTSSEPVFIRGDQRPGPDDYYTFKSTLTIKARQQRLQIVVHDQLGGGVLASSTSLLPGSTR